MSRRGLAALLLLLSLGWLAAVAAAPRVMQSRAASPALRTTAGVVYLAASVICHQRSERSYHVQGAPLPLCARCLGLHAGASLGLLAWLWAPDAWRRRVMRRARPALILAAAPTALSIGLEWAGAGSPLASRTLTALPFGVVAAWLVGAALTGRPAAPAEPGRPQPSATLP